MKGRLLDAVAWVIFIVVIVGFLVFVGSLSGPRPDQRQTANTRENWSVELTWAAQHEQDEENRDDYATHQALEFEALQEYEERRGRELELQFEKMNRDEDR